MKNLEREVEAIIFSSDKPVSERELIEILNNREGEEFIASEKLQETIENLKEKYDTAEYSFALREIGGGYQFLTKSEYHKLINLLLNQRIRRRLSTAALETLAIIAYKQPVTKQEIEHIRGVSADYSLTKLLDKELISISGRANLPGKPILYGLSESFMEYFGINSINDLPKPKDLSSIQGNEIGEKAE